jgi:DnaA family protein
MHADHHLMQQITLDIGTPLTPTLDNFFAGPNVEVVSHLRQWLHGAVHGAGRSALACFIAGAPGSGKSHLISALAHAVGDKGESVGILRPDSPAAADFNPAWAAVILEDVHGFDAPLQHTAFNWFVNAQTYQRAVFATGNTTPRALVLREDLRTRLGGGQIFQLQALTEALKAVPTAVLLASHLCARSHVYLARFTLPGGSHRPRPFQPPGAQPAVEHPPGQANPPPLD